MLEQSEIDFLFPRDLEVSGTPFKKILVTGECQSQDNINNWKVSEPHITFDFELFNNTSSLPDKSRADVQDYSFQYIRMNLRAVVTDRIVNFRNWQDKTRRNDLIERAISLQEIWLDALLKYNRDYGLLAIVSNYMIPNSKVAPSLKSAGTDDDFAAFVAFLNKRIAERVAETPNAFLADVNFVASAMGKSMVIDDWIDLYAHNSTFPGHWTESSEPPNYLQFQNIRIDHYRKSKYPLFHKLCFRQAESIYRTVLQLDQVKLVIFDLDNTLHRGQIAEHFRDDAIWPSDTGWPVGIAEAIQHLRARGILVAICSKNDHQMVVDRWKRVQSGGFINLDDFVATKINWEPKAANVAEILAETSLTDKSVVFVDDNPVERESVKAAFPRIRVIGENQFKTRNILLRSAETNVAMLTGESTRREEMIKGQINRERQRATMSREQFLATLGVRVAMKRISNSSQEGFIRALELINKTNQFNTTGQRRGSADIQGLFESGGYLVAFDVTDKFVEYGLVGVMVVAGNTIEQFVMSCRVLGLGVDQTVVASTIQNIRKGGRVDIVARLVPTPDNSVCRDVYAKLGFIAKEADPELFVYPADLEAAAGSPHVELLSA